MKKLLFIGLISAALVGCSNGNESQNSNNPEKNEVSVKTEKSENNTSVNQDKNVKTENGTKTETITENGTKAETITENGKQKKFSETTTSSIKNTETKGNQTINVQKNEQKPVNNVKQEEKTVLAEGTFYGLADTSSLEIESNGESNVYYFSEDLTNTVNAIPFEGKVKFQYKKNDVGQLVLLGIQQN